MKTATDQVDTSSLANIFFGKSFSAASTKQSGSSSFGSLLSNLVNSKSNVSFSNAQKPVVAERSSASPRQQEVSHRDSSDTVRHAERDVQKADRTSEKPKASSKDAAGESREKASFEKPAESTKHSDAETVQKEELLQQSHKIIKKLNSNDDSSVESELSALRADETVGEFWQSLDDQAALDLIETLEAMSPDVLAATLSLLKKLSPEVQQISLETEEQSELVEAVDAISREEDTEMPEGEEESSSEEEVETVSAQALVVPAEVQVKEHPELAMTDEAPSETEAVTAVQGSRETAVPEAAAKETERAADTGKKAETPAAAKKEEATTSDSQVKDALAALRSDPETAEFWKSVDDETAHKLLSVLSKMKGSRTGEELVATLSGQESAEIDPEILAAVSAAASPKTMGAETEAVAAEKSAGKKLREKSEGINDSSVTPSDEPIAEHARKSATFGSEVKSLRQEFREATASRVHPSSTQTGTAGAAASSAGAFSVTTSAQAAISGEAPDLSDLLKSFNSRGETAKADGIPSPNAASNHGVKRVSMSGHEASREFSFSRDQSQNMASVRSDAAQAKSGDSVKSAIFSQIIEKAEFFKGPQQVKVMTLQLKPESLGKLEMQIATKDGAVTARISAENSVVKEKLEQLVPQIREHLSQQGVNILQISVDISRRESDGNGKGFSDGEYQHGLRIGSRKGARGGSADIGDSDSSVLINPEIRRMALNIQAVDVTV